MIIMFRDPEGNPHPVDSNDDMEFDEALDHDDWYVDFGGE